MPIEQNQELRPALVIVHGGGWRGGSKSVDVFQNMMTEYAKKGYWRAALVLFFNGGVDTGTVWKSAGYHEPILWRHVSWDRQSPDRDMKEQSPWGWLYYRRVKTGKAFYRPMNRVVHAHLQSLMPEHLPVHNPLRTNARASRFQNS